MEVRMSLADAASLTGVATNTIRSRFKAGKIKGERDNSGKIWVWIDPNLEGSKHRTSKPSNEGSNDTALETLSSQLAHALEEADRLRSKALQAHVLEAERALLIERIEELKADRDAWRHLSERRRLWGLFRR